MLEPLTNLFAPSRCLFCDRVGSGICQSCRESSITSVPSRCFSCHKSTLQSKTCSSCLRKTGLNNVFVVTHYDELAKKVVWDMKFQRMSFLAKSIAGMMDDTLPLFPDDILVSYVPTADSRIRRRGYDQSRLIAKELARRRNYVFKPLLSRTSATR